MNTQTAIVLYKGVFKMNEDQEILEYLKGVLSAEQELALEDNMVVFFTTDDGCYSLDKNHSICGNIWNNLSYGHEIDDIIRMVERKDEVNISLTCYNELCKLAEGYSKVNVTFILNY